MSLWKKNCKPISWQLSTHISTSFSYPKKRVQLQRKKNYDLARKFSRRIQKSRIFEKRHSTIHKKFWDVFSEIHFLQVVSTSFDYQMVATACR